MRIPNLTHGSFFMLGAYFGVTLLAKGMNFWLAALASAAAMARDRRRRSSACCCAGWPAQELAQVLVTLGLVLHHRRRLPDGVDRRSDRSRRRRAQLRGAMQAFGLFFPTLSRSPSSSSPSRSPSRCGCMLDRTRLGAMIRAGVDDRRWRAWSASASRSCSRSCSAWAPALAGLRRRDRRAVSCRSIPGSTPRCCRWPWSW